MMFKLTDTIKAYLFGGLAVLLAGSLIYNWWLYGQVMEANRDAAQLELQVQNVREAANLCSRNTARLEEEMKARREAAKPVIDAARAGEKDAGKKAAVILTTPPSKPNDDYGSTRDLIKTWMENYR